MYIYQEEGYNNTDFVCKSRINTITVGYQIKLKLIIDKL